MSDHYDTIIAGAGAAGLFCGAVAAQHGARVLVLDHARKPAEKVRISGGGRCNFTNIHTDASAFLSENPHFAKSALARYTPEDFCALMSKHGLSWTEKTLGQLFCDQKSGAVIKLLLDELEQAGGALKLETTINTIRQDSNGFQLNTSIGPLSATKLVIATGGLSIPKMGATGFAYDIAAQFGIDVIPPRPALVPLTFSGALKDDFAALSGVATDVRAEAAGAAFDEALLFTHRGLSGPAILQISSYWREQEAVLINLLPGANAADMLLETKRNHPKRTLANTLGEHLPVRLVDMLMRQLDLPGASRLADISDARLTLAAKALCQWSFTPTGTEGWRTAEVTAGGIDTNALSSKTMEAKAAPGLYFIGECVDVTGWLGGYNFQWAWASAFAAGSAIAS